MLYLNLTGMASVRAILRDKTNKEGLHPVALRIVAQRSSAYIFTDFYLKKDQWNTKEREVKKSHANSKRINAYLLHKRREIESFIIDHKLDEKKTKAKTIKDLFLDKKDLEAKEDTIQSNKFFPFAEERLKELKRIGKFNHYGTLRSQLRIIKEYAGDGLLFSDIDKVFLDNLSAWLRRDGNGKTRSKRTIADYLITIKSLYNRAIDHKIITKDNYPFGRGKVRIKLTQSLKMPLSKEDIKKLEEVTPETTSDGRWHARCIFLFSYYNAGMRFRDVICLKKNAIIDGALPYRMSKNDKTHYLELHEKALEIAEYYKTNFREGDHLFPHMDGRVIEDDFDKERRIKSINRTINNRLTGLAKSLGIEKKISMHVARHTFANHSGNKIPIQLLQVLYRHSSINTTIDYQRQFIQEELKHALNKVLD